MVPVAPRPFQTVVFFPNTGAVFVPFEEYLLYFEFVVKSGRAVVYPIYKGTHERSDEAIGFDGTVPNLSKAYADHVTQWINDLRRSIDYLETREDIATTKLGFLGDSWGGELGPIALALEERLSLGILYNGGSALRGKKR